MFRLFLTTITLLSGTATGDALLDYFDSSPSPSTTYEVNTLHK